MEVLKGLATGTPSLAQAIRDTKPGLAVASRARGEAKAFDIATKAAETVYGDYVAKGVDRDTAAALARDVANRVIRDERIADTIAEAAVQVCDREKAAQNAENLDESWFGAFRDHVSKEADEEVRYVWAKLLAGELDEPGSYSKRTMSIFADMSKNDALDFEHVCSLAASTLKGAKYSLTLPLEIDGSGTSYNNNDISFGTLSYLQSLGLLSSTSTNYTVPANGSIGFWYGTDLDRAVLVMNKTDDGKRLKFGGFQLTICGEQLAGLCEVGTSPNVAKYIKRLCTKQGFDFFDLPLPASE